MSETENIALMAKKVSDEIFEVFGWTRVGPPNQNWTCVELEKHAKTRSLTHPSDAVFKYRDPYSGLDQYVTMDLKSLGAGSIQGAKIIRALRSLSQSAECGIKSESWQNLYLQPGDNPALIGLLFVYNHDNEYDKNFDQQLSRITPSKISASSSHRTYAMGPYRVNYLTTIANDITWLRGKRRLPDQAFCQFYYPDSHSSRPRQQLSPIATLESLLGPWIVIRYEEVNQNASVGRGVYVYYSGPGESEDEFQYLFDYLFRYQLVDGVGPVEIRLALPHAEASAVFEKAKRLYLKNYWSILDESKTGSVKRMETLKYASIATQKSRLSELEIGFENG